MEAVLQQGCQKPLPLPCQHTLTCCNICSTSSGAELDLGMGMMTTCNSNKKHQQNCCNNTWQQAAAQKTLIRGLQMERCLTGA
jgi:hypothetical protein